MANKGGKRKTISGVRVRGRVQTTITSHSGNIWSLLGGGGGFGGVLH